MTSFAASPFVPIVTVGLAGALIVGTSYGSNSEIRQNKADARSAQAQKEYEEEQAKRAAGTNLSATEQQAALEAAAAAAGGDAAAAAPTEVTTNCTATSCTVVFPIAGGSTKVFGKALTMTKGFKNAGGAFNLAGKAGPASVTKPGNFPGYTFTVTKADASSVTVTVAKAA